MNKDKANEILKQINKEITESDEGKIEINGKKYTTVGRRIELFRKYFGINGRLNSEILESTSESSIVKAIVEIDIDGAYLQVAMGTAQKYRSNSQMEMNSALEFCETASVGRALANLGISGGEFASANEIEEKTKGSENEQNNSKKTTTKQKKTTTIKSKQEGITTEQIKYLMRMKDLDKYLSDYNVMRASDLTKQQASDIIETSKGEITL
jgi:hypothetical protein